MISILLMLVSFLGQASVEVKNETIVIHNEPQFEKMLELKSFEKMGQSASLSDTGYIIAATQFSFDGGRPSSNWVTLDNKVLQREKVGLDELKFPVGTAYGIVNVSLDFSQKFKVDQKIIVRRYGIRKDHFEGKIFKIVARPALDVVQIHFLVKGEELIPGSSCEVTIEDVKIVPFKISLLSLLHIGLEDYIVVKTAQGQYVPRHVTLLDQKKEEAEVMLPVRGDELYVARGAILLKPLLFQILEKNEANQ